MLEKNEAKEASPLSLRRVDPSDNGGIPVIANFILRYKTDACRRE